MVIIHRRLRKYGNGVIRLNTKVTSKQYLKIGFNQDFFFEFIDVNGKRKIRKINDFAYTISNLYLKNKLDFWESDAFLNDMMIKLDWNAPKRFWKIFLIFESGETKKVPDKTVKFALVKYLKSINILK